MATCANDRQYVGGYCIPKSPGPERSKSIGGLVLIGSGILVAIFTLWAFINLFWWNVSWMAWGVSVTSFSVYMGPIFGVIVAAALIIGGRVLLTRNAKKAKSD